MIVLKKSSDVILCDRYRPVAWLSLSPDSENMYAAFPGVVERDADAYESLYMCFL